jgi:predicted RNA-binding protein YlqC (UPF0109 family)
MIDLGFVPVVLGFAVEHWDFIVAFGGLIGKIVFDKKNQYDIEAAKKQAFKMAVDATKLMAKETIGKQEKRHQAIKFVLEALPEKQRKLVPLELVEVLVEQAYQLVVKPSL